jgi:AcrR family transcriptional regulator
MYESGAEPRRSDARANRQRVLQAAHEVFGARGEDAEVREIADRAGVGLATIYRGFGNKEGLLTALADRAQGDLIEVFSAAERESRPPEQLHCLLVGAVDYVKANGPLFDILAGRFRTGVHDRFLNLHGRLGEIIERGVAARDFRTDINPQVVELLLLGSLVSMAHARAILPEIGAKEFADGVLDLLAPSRK